MYSMKHQVIIRDLCWISCFCCFSDIFNAFYILFIKNTTVHTKVAIFMKTNKTIVSICVYICTIYTHIHHMHHQIPPKYKRYLVGLPSVLYERPSQNKRPVLNQLFLLIFSAFHLESAGLIQKVPLFMKTNKIRSICVYTYTIYTYMHHQIS